MPSESRLGRKQQGENVPCVTQQKSSVGVLPSTLIPKGSEQLANWLEKVPDNPTMAANAARTLIGQSRAQLDDAKLFASVVGYKAAMQFKESREKWKQFAEDPVWSSFPGHKPKAQQPEDELRWMMIFIMDARDDRGKDRANVYRGALQAKFDEGVPPDALIAYVKRSGGIDAAYRQALELRRVAADDDSDDSSSDSDNVEDGYDSDSSEEKDGEEDTVKSRHPSDGALKSKKVSAAEAILIGKIRKIEQDGMIAWIVGLPTTDVIKKARRYAQDGSVFFECHLTATADKWLDTTCARIRRGRPKS